MVDHHTDMLIPIRCEHVSRDDAVAADVSLRGTLALDSVLLGDSWMHVVGQYTIPCFHRSLMLMATCDQVSTVKNTFAFIISKTLPQKCMMRKFSIVCMKKLEKEPHLEEKIRQLVLCSLLGNYRHCTASSRPRIRARRMLIELLHYKNKTPAKVAWFRSMFRKCGHLVGFVLRDYLVSAVEDIPSLLEHMRHLFDWDQFRASVLHTMDRVRSYFNFSAMLDHSPFLYSLDSEPDLTALQRDLNLIVGPAHDRLLAVCYKRYNQSVISTLCSLRKKVPLIAPAVPPLNPLSTVAPESDEWNPFAQSDSDSDSEDDADLDSDSEDAPPAKRRRENSESHREDEDKDETEDLTQFVTPQQCSVLNMAVQRLISSRANVMMRLVSFFVFFGVSERVVAHVREVVHQLQEGVLTLEDQKHAMRELACRDRHAYNLLHVASALLKERQRCCVLRQLPVHYFENQLEAVQERYGMQIGGDKVLDSSLLFRFCGVCDRVYSLVRDFHSVYKNDYTWGLRDAVTDYTTMEVYCEDSKSNHRGRCGEKPLCAVPLLGQLLFFKGKTILLCPQKSCGMPMILDVNLCAFTERGPACKDCTLKLQKTQLYTAPPVSRCVYCASQSSKPQNTFMYPHATALCRKHNLKGMTEFIRSKRPKTREETVKLIVAFTHHKRKERYEARLPQMKRDLARRKMASRSNIRR